jgi:hypothetical protein
MTFDDWKTTEAASTANEWDTYEPESAQEFDDCAACRTGREHTVAEHRTLALESTRERRRALGLERAARFVYQQARDVEF